MILLRFSKALSKPCQPFKIPTSYYHSSLQKYPTRTSTPLISRLVINNNININNKRPTTFIHTYKQQPYYQHIYNNSNSNNNIRLFHSSSSTKSPIIPLPALLLGALKSGKLVSFISLSSKTSLTLLPHAFRRNKGKFIGKLLVSIPIIGIALLVIVGLDQAPNTSRLRFAYLTEEEEHEELEKVFNQYIQENEKYKLPNDHPTVIWLQSIVNNIAKVSDQDIRDPVKPYGATTSNGDGDDDDQQQPMYKVSVLADGNTLNACCCGKNIIVYDLLLDVFDYDEAKIAVILSHEIAHSVQRHYVETHGMASFLLMLGDITRGVFWVVTESLGPYVNQFINDFIIQFIALETQTTYNRPLEREADLVGLKFLAKSGYDPTLAVEVWEKFSQVEKIVERILKEEKENKNQGMDVDDDDDDEISTTGYTVSELMASALSTWFGSTHPPSDERVQYMKEHMDDAIILYNDAIRLNGSPIHEALKGNEVIEIESGWFKSFYNRLWPASY